MGTPSPFPTGYLHSPSRLILPTTQIGNIINTCIVHCIVLSYLYTYCLLYLKMIVKHILFLFHFAVKYSFIIYAFTKQFTVTPD